MVVGEMIEKFRKTSIEKIRKTSIDKLEKLRKTSRGRSNRRTSRDSSCMCIEYRGSFKLLLLGDQGVGKTSICAKYTAFDEELLKTLHENGQRDETFSSCIYLSSGNKKARQYDLDIAIANGLYWKGTVNGYKEKIQESNGFLLVYSKENRQSYMKLIEILSDIRKIKKMIDIPVVIVGNKSDLNEIKTLQVKDCEHIVLGEYPHFDVSAVENIGIQEAFKCLSQMCAQMYDQPVIDEEKEEKIEE